MISNSLIIYSATVIPTCCVSERALFRRLGITYLRYVTLLRKRFVKGMKLKILSTTEELIEQCWHPAVEGDVFVSNLRIYDTDKQIMVTYLV